MLSFMMLFPEKASSQHVVADYDFETPDRVLKLSHSLKEISGLASGPDGQLYAVQDEDGIIYQLDPEDGSILAKQRFEGSGDYEGIERVGGTMFVLRSSGHLFAIDIGSGEGIKATRKSRLDLPSRCDAEALGSDTAVGTMWVACKNTDGTKGKKTRSLFEITFQKGKWETELVLSIDQSVLNEASGKKKWKVKDVRPSGLTIKNETVFVLSAVNDLLLILQPQRTDIIDLGRLGLQQAEGIAIDTDGTLFIASEGVGSRAKVLVFKHNPTNSSN